MKRILITGGSGQLAQALYRQAPQNYSLALCDRHSLDITRTTEVEEKIKAIKPDWVINAAAYTAVDKAESDESQAHAVNVVAAGELAKLSRTGDFRLLHISTDFVFNGELARPYRPEDAIAPLCVYGRTKAQGERAIVDADSDAVIVRSSWLYGPTGQNFLLTMIRLMLERESLQVVDDQTGTPTLVDDLASCLWDAIDFSIGGGIYHCSSSGTATWFDFAAVIREKLSRAVPDRSLAVLTPISTEDYGAPAPRPAYSALEFSMGRIDKPMRSWTDALESIDFAKLLRG